MFKVYHEMLPPVIQHLFSKRHTISKYITRQTNTFQTPKTTTTLTKRSIIFQGPTEFNKLITDPNITLNTSIHTYYLTFEILLTYVPPKSLENGRYVLGSLVLLS